MLTINESKAREVSLAISELELRGDSYLDELLFPSPNDDLEHQMAFFTSMVAIDHRTRSLSPFEAEISGRKLVGSDLLYHLGLREYHEDPSIFSPENLKELPLERALRILSHDNAMVWDLHVRTLLLRDLGKKVLMYFGSFSSLLSVDSVKKLLNRLRVFRAYEDPVQKKSFLLAKFLHRRGLISFNDPKNWHVPVDNHLTRIAYRLGLVTISPGLKKLIRSKVELSANIDSSLRFSVRSAWKSVVEGSGVDAFTLDDFLWKLGREICLEEAPKCLTCPLRRICRAAEVGDFITEHTHLITWYY